MFFLDITGNFVEDIFVVLFKMNRNNQSNLWHVMDHLKYKIYQDKYELTVFETKISEINLKCSKQDCIIKLISS